MGIFRNTQRLEYYSNHQNDNFNNYTFCDESTVNNIIMEMARIF